MTINVWEYDPYTGSAGVVKPFAIPPFVRHGHALVFPNEANAVGAGVSPTVTIILPSPGSVTAAATGAGVNPTVSFPFITPIVGAAATGAGVNPTITINRTPAAASASAVGVTASVTLGGSDISVTGSWGAASGAGVKPNVSTGGGTGFGNGPFGLGSFGGTGGLQADPSAAISALASGATWDGGNLSYLTPAGVYITQPATIQNATFIDPYQYLHTAASGTGDQNGGPFTLTMVTLDTTINGFTMPYVIADGQQTIEGGQGINKRLTRNSTSASGLVLTMPSVVGIDHGQSVTGAGITGGVVVDTVVGNNVTLKTQAGGTITTLLGNSPYVFFGDGLVTITAVDVPTKTITLSFTGSANCDAPLGVGDYRFRHVSRHPGQQLSVKPLVEIKSTSNVTLTNVTTYGSNGGTIGYHADLVGQAGFSAESVTGLTINNCVANDTCGDGMTLTGNYPNPGTASVVTINGFVSNNAGRESMTIGSVQGTALNPCILSNITLNNGTFGAGIDFEGDVVGAGSGYLVFNNLNTPDGGIRLVSPMYGPITFNNAYAYGGTSLRYSAGVSGQLITFNGGTMVLSRNPTNPPADIYVEAGGQMTLNNVALIWKTGTITPGAAWYVQEPSTAPASSGPPTQGSVLTLHQCTLVGVPVTQANGVCTGNGTTDLSQVIIT